MSDEYALKLHLLAFLLRVVLLIVTFYTNQGAYVEDDVVTKRVVRGYGVANTLPPRPAKLSGPSFSLEPFEPSNVKERYSTPSANNHTTRTTLHRTH